MLGIFVLIGAAILVVHGCQQSERSRFLACFGESHSSGQTLYYGGDAYYDQINRDDAVAAAKMCYDDRTIDPLAEPPGYR